MSKLLSVLAVAVVWGWMDAGGWIQRHRGGQADRFTQETASRIIRLSEYQLAAGLG